MKYSNKFRVEPGSKVKLDEVDAGFTDRHESHQHALPEIEAYSQKLHDLQYLMYAEGKRSLLICLQGRDAAGKDGTITYVLGAMNPQGCTVTGFKVPSKEEAAHDFLWRYHGNRTGGHLQPFPLQGDYAERPFWDAYTDAFEALLGKCSTAHAPWFVIPSNHKWFRNLAISKIVVETLEKLDMQFPAPTVSMDEIKKKYHQTKQAAAGK